MKLTWKISEQRFRPVTHKLFIGKAHVGTFYKPLHVGRFCASCRLSGSKCETETLEEAKAWVEKCVREFVSDAGLTGGENDKK